MTAFARKPRPSRSSNGAALLVQRKCACGATASATSGRCSESETKKKLRLQTKMRIGEAGDAYGQEAGRIADQVMSGDGMRRQSQVGARPVVQRKDTGEEASLDASSVVQDAL